MYIERSGQFRTDSMFAERINSRQKKAGLKPVYSLAERSQRTDTQNLYDIFINSADEYDFAIKAFGSKQQLDKLKEIKWFMEGFRSCTTYRGYAAWLDDLALRDNSMAKKVLIEKTMDGDVSAAKKLYDMSKPDVATKGRPKKEDIMKAAAKKADEMSEIEDDIKRLNVVKLRG